MNVRKTFSFCVAALLLVGFASGGAFAQDDLPDGFYIRVTQPDSGDWAAIGDTVKVVIKSNPKLIEITSAKVGLTPGVTDSLLGDVDGNNSVDGDEGNYVSAPKLAADDTVSGEAIFEFELPVDPGSGESSTSKLVVASSLTVVSGTDTLDLFVYNTSTEEVVFDLPTYGVVGDNVKLGVDGLRPAGKITTLTVTPVDTTQAEFPKKVLGQTVNAFKAGDQLDVEITGSFSSGDVGVVYMVPLDTIDAADPAAVALETLDFPFALLIADETKVTFTVEAGKYEDNLRVAGLGFVTDKAGNLSHTTKADSQTPEGITSSLVHVIDSTDPVITMANPLPDSGEVIFTKDLEQDYDRVLTTTGDVDTETATLKPLSFKVSEGVTKVEVTFGDSTLDLTLAGGDFDDTVEELVTMF
jgi:hypothetical protein